MNNLELRRAQHEAATAGEWKGTATEILREFDGGTYRVAKIYSLAERTANRNHITTLHNGEPLTLDVMEAVEAFLEYPIVGNRDTLIAVFDEWMEVK